MPNALLKRLADNPKVKRVHRDREAQGEMARTAAAVGALTARLSYGYTGAGVGVAVIDSGITAWHDDLGASATSKSGQRVTAFVDFVNNRTAKYDDWGHGTHVAGIIAGSGYDSYGQRAGIAPGASIVALKALDDEGKGRISNIIAALDWVVANRAQYNIRVVNMSLGAGVFESYHTDPLTLAAKRAVDAGIVVVAAAGNMGKALNGQPQYGAISAPGNAPWVLTVGASSTEGTTDRRDDKMAAYSSRGPTMIDFGAKPDLVAPGTGTVSLVDTEQPVLSDEDPLPRVGPAVRPVVSAVPHAERHEHGDPRRRRQRRADAGSEPEPHAEHGEGDPAIHLGSEEGLRLPDAGRRLPQYARRRAPGALLPERREGRCVSGYARVEQAHPLGQQVACAAAC